MKINDEVKSTIALANLYNVIDPEIGLNVVDLGLIYELSFDEEKMQIDCSMTLTTKLCPMGESIVNSVKNTLSDAFPNYKIELHLVFEPEWSYENISEAGLDFLNN